MIPPLTGVFSLSFFRLTTGGGQTKKVERTQLFYQMLKTAIYIFKYILPILGNITSSMFGTGVGSSISLVKSSSCSSSGCPRFLLCKYSVIIMHSTYLGSLTWEWQHSWVFSVSFIKWENKMVTSMKAFLRCPNINNNNNFFFKHMVLLQLSNKVDEEETQNAKYTLFFSLGVFCCLQIISKAEYSVYCLPLGAPIFESKLGGSEESLTFWIRTQHYKTKRQKAEQKLQPSVYLSVFAYPFFPFFLLSEEGEGERLLFLMGVDLVSCNQRKWIQIMWKWK